MHHACNRRHDCRDRDARDRAGPQVDPAVAARQPPARLPRVRRRGPVRIAGYDLQVWCRGQLLRRSQESSRRAEMVACRLLRPAALHPLLSLCAHVRRRDGRLCAWHPESRFIGRHRAEFARGRESRSARPCGLRAVRHVHRRMSRGCVDQRHLQVQDAPVGDESRGHHLHPLRGRLQDHARRTRDHRRRHDRTRRQSR
jgi:hypothetical protein